MRIRLLLLFFLTRFLCAADFDPAVFDAQVEFEQTNATLSAARWKISYWLVPDRGEPFLKSHHSTDAKTWEQQGLRAEHFMAHPEAITAWEKALEFDPSSQLARAHLTYLLSPVNPSRSASLAVGLNAQGLDHLALFIHQQFWSGQAKWESVKWAKGVALILDALKPEQIAFWNASFLIQATDAMTEPRIPSGDYSIPSILDTQTPLPTHGSMTGILRDRLLTYRTILRSLKRIPSCAVPAVRRLRCIDFPTSGDPSIAIEALKIAIKPGAIPAVIAKLQLPSGFVPVDLPLLEEDLAGYEKLPPLPAVLEAKVQSFKALRQNSAQDYPSAAAKVLQLYPDPDGVTAVMRQWWQRKLEIDPLPLIKDNLAYFPVTDTRWMWWMSSRCPDAKERELLVDTILRLFPADQHKSLLEHLAGDPALAFIAIRHLEPLPEDSPFLPWNSGAKVLGRCVPKHGIPDFIALETLIRASPWIGAPENLRLTLLWKLRCHLADLSHEERLKAKSFLQKTFPDDALIQVIVILSDYSLPDRTQRALQQLGRVAPHLVSTPQKAKEFKDFTDEAIPGGFRLTATMDESGRAVGEAIKDTRNQNYATMDKATISCKKGDMAMILFSDLTVFDSTWQQFWKSQIILNKDIGSDGENECPGPMTWIEHIVSNAINFDNAAGRKKLIAVLRDNPKEVICLADRFVNHTAPSLMHPGVFLPFLQEEYRTEVALMPEGDVSVYLPMWNTTLQDLKKSDVDAFAVWLETQTECPLRSVVLLSTYLRSAILGGDKIACQKWAKTVISLLPAKCSPGWRLTLVATLLNYEWALGCQLVPDEIAASAVVDFMALQELRPRRLCETLRLNIARRLVSLSDQNCRDQAANLLPNQWMPEQKESIFDLATESLQVTSLLERPCRQVTTVARLLELAIRSGDEKKVDSILAIQNGAILRVSGVWAMLLRLNRPDLLQRALASTDKVVYEPTDELWRADRWQKDSINAQTLTEDQRFLLQFAVEILPQTPRPSEIRGHYVKSDFQNVSRRCQTMTVLAQKRTWKDPAFITKLQQLCSTFFTPTTDALCRLARDNSLSVDPGDSRQVWGAIALGDPLPLKAAVAKGFDGMNNHGLLYMVRSKLADPLGKEKPWTSASIAHLRECVSVLIAQHEKDRMFNPWGETSEWAFISFLVADKFKDFEELTKRVRLIPGTGSDLQFEIEVFIKTLLRMTTPKAEGGDREAVIGRLVASPWMAKFKIRNAPNIAKKKGDMQSILLQLLPALETQAIKNQDAEGLKSLAKTWTNLGQTAKAENCQKEADKLAATP